MANWSDRVPRMNQDRHVDAGTQEFILNMGSWYNTAIPPRLLVIYGIYTSTTCLTVTNSLASNIYFKIKYRDGQRPSIMPLVLRKLWHGINIHVLLSAVV